MNVFREYQMGTLARNGLTLRYRLNVFRTLSSISLHEKCPYIPTFGLGMDQKYSNTYTFDAVHQIELFCDNI